MSGLVDDSWILISTSTFNMSCYVVFEINEENPSLHRYIIGKRRSIIIDFFRWLWIFFDTIPKHDTWQLHKGELWCGIWSHLSLTLLHCPALWMDLSSMCDSVTTILANTGSLNYVDLLNFDHFIIIQKRNNICSYFHWSHQSNWVLGSVKLRAEDWSFPKF